ncbi:unnamed protein product, partial [Prorocentrum cordatum]
ANFARGKGYSHQACRSSEMPSAPSVGSINAGQPSERKKKQQTVAQRRAQRPLTLVDHLMDPSSTWTCAVTGAQIPSNLNRKEKGWAAIVGSIVFWLNKLADEFGRMMLDKRFWPTNLIRRLRVIPDAFYTCRHLPTSVEHGCNGYGQWWVCSSCTMRVACCEVKPEKGKPKVDVSCVCKRTTAARTLCGKGFAQYGAPSQDWQALVNAPAPPPGSFQGGVTPAGTLPPWPAARDRRAAEEVYRGHEEEQPDAVMEDVEEQARQVRAQRREDSSRAPAKRPMIEGAASSDDAGISEETLQILKNLAAKQEAQDRVIAGLQSTISGQMNALATMRSQLQSNSQPGAPLRQQPEFPPQQVPPQPTLAHQLSPQPVPLASAPARGPGRGGAAAVTGQMGEVGRQGPPDLHQPAGVPPGVPQMSIATPPTQVRQTIGIGMTPQVAAAAGPSVPWPPPKGHAASTRSLLKKDTANPRGIRDKEGQLVSSSTISSIATFPSVQPSQEPAPATPAGHPTATAWQRETPQPRERPGRPQKASDAAWQRSEDERAWEAQEHQKDVEKRRLAQEGWTPTGWQDCRCDSSDAK